MKNTTLFLLKYLLIWIILSGFYILFSEKITKLIAPGFDSVEIWVFVVAIGLGLIFIAVLTTFLIAFVKRK